MSRRLMIAIATSSTLGVWVCQSAAVVVGQCPKLGCNRELSWRSRGRIYAGHKGEFETLSR